MIEMLVDLFGKFSPEEMRAIKDDDLTRRGQTIQEQDIFIAATAIARGLILVSNDSDLLRVEGLSLKNKLSKDS